jgi:hypothetical protein
MPSRLKRMYGGEELHFVTYARLLLAFAYVLLIPCPAQDRGARSSPAPFSNPQRVAILGYEDDAMEPFVTRDGKYLFFNNSNDPSVNTNLHWAQRVDDSTFRYEGEIAGVNTRSLEGVPSMDRQGVFYFISNRSYDQTASTVYRGKFSAGSVSGVELVPGISIAKPGVVNFDAEISADGNSMYFVESHFSFGKPKDARIVIARRNGNAFVRAGDSDSIMATVNVGGFSYAPATSASELEIFFTRLGPNGPAIFTATRSNTAAPFAATQTIEAINGFVEAPTLSYDGKSLYYHKKENGRFVIYRVSRPFG